MEKPPAGQFAGPIYPVNLKYSTLGGALVFKRVADLPQAPDLAVLCTPPETFAILISELGRLGTRAAIALSALLQVAVVNLHLLNRALGTAPLSLTQWVVCSVMASSVLWVSKLRKWGQRLIRKVL